MRPNRKHRLRLPAPRWPSTDHRDYQTVGRLRTWWSRRSQPAARPAVRHDGPAVPELPALTQIVRVRREDAVLHVDLLARFAAAEDRPRVLARGDATAGDTAAERMSGLGSEERTWTVSLLLN